MRISSSIIQPCWFVMLFLTLFFVSCTSEVTTTNTPVPDELTPTQEEPTPTVEVTDVDRGECTGDVMLIGTIQSGGMTSEMVGDTVIIEGLVVGDGEADAIDSTTDIRGFYVQDFGDGDSTTSDGIFVFTNIDEHSDEGLVDEGDYVRVTGRVSEFPTNNGGLSQTQISLTNPEENLTVCSRENPLPPPIEITLPFENLSQLEQYESMLVTFPQELTVTELFLLEWHGQLTLSSDGRLWQPTHLATPGDDSKALSEANQLNQIVVDDFDLTLNPDPIIFPAPELRADNIIRGGDTITGITGILTHSRARVRNNPETTVTYRLRVNESPQFEHANPRPTELPDLGETSLVIASFNVLNFFTTIDPNQDSSSERNICGPNQNFGCRGADSEEEYDRQLAKLVNAVLKLDADILGLNELENNSGSDDAIQALVNALNDKTVEDTYSFVDTGTIGTDAIRVGFIYKTESVTPVSNFATLESVDPFNRNTRPPLAQLWQDTESEEQFYVIVNHFKSKSSTNCPGSGANADTGDGQGCWNDDRVLAATQLLNWVENDDYFDDDPDILIIGDLNAYAMEDPIRALVDGGYTNLIATFGDDEVYSFVFNGQWGYLDHALANETMVTQVTGVGEFHINADEPSVLDYNMDFKTANQIQLLYNDAFYRVSDHDPLLIGLNFGE